MSFSPGSVVVRSGSGCQALEVAIFMGFRFETKHMLYILTLEECFPTVKSYGGAYDSYELESNAAAWLAIAACFELSHDVCLNVTSSYETRGMSPTAVRARDSRTSSFFSCSSVLIKSTCLYVASIQNRERAMARITLLHHKTKSTISQEGIQLFPHLSNK
jgi:hypothetical protein